MPSLAGQACERVSTASPAARAGTPEQHSAVGAVGVSGPLALITHWVREQEMSRLEKGLGRAFGKEAEAPHWLFTPSDKEKGRYGEG